MASPTRERENLRSGGAPDNQSRRATRRAGITTVLALLTAAQCQDAQVRAKPGTRGVVLRAARADAQLVTGDA